MMPADHDDRLRGWKEIAAFLHTGERTAQRWERQHGMPVHRIETAGNTVVLASRTELDAWQQSVAGQAAVAQNGTGAEPESAGDHLEQAGSSLFAAVSLVLGRRRHLALLAAFVAVPFLALAGYLLLTHSSGLGSTVASTANAATEPESATVSAPRIGRAARVDLRCTSLRGGTAVLGIALGREATWKVDGHPLVTIVASPANDGLLVTLGVVQPDNGSLSPLAELLLKAHVKTAVPKPDTSGMATMEWISTVEPGASAPKRTSAR
jgi:hypothetical protein